MDKELRNRLRAEGQGLDATVNVGKGGVTDGVLEELDAQLKRNHLVKVRLQRPLLSPRREKRSSNRTNVSRSVTSARW